MAVVMNNNSSTTTSTMNSNGKRRLLPNTSTTTQKSLTNCQLIDCVANNSNSGGTSSNSAAAAAAARYQARNVSWNYSGSLLAVGCSDGIIRFWNPVLGGEGSDSSNTSNQGVCCNKDVGSINTTTTTITTSSQTGPPVIAAKFHPTTDPILCSMTAGSGMLRLWDVRTSSSTTSSTITSTTTNATTGSTISSSLMSSCSTTTTTNTTSSATSPQLPLPITVAVEWNPIQTHIIACTTHDGQMSIYDTRKFTSRNSKSNNNGTTNTNSSATATANTGAALVRKIQFPFINDRIESCIFDRMSGKYIIAGVTNRDHNNSNDPSSCCSGMGYIKICQWDDGDDAKNTNRNTETDNSSVVQQQIPSSNNIPKQQQHQRPWYSYPAHAGPIYAIASNRSGTQLATGGSDAVVGVWDVAATASSSHSSCCCTSTISSRKKLIRAVAFAPDDTLFAIATEEDVIELIDCSNRSGTTTTVGLAHLSSSNHNNNTSSSRRSVPGAEDISFHPSMPYLLACARRTDVPTPSGMSSVTMLKLTVTSSS